MPIAGQVLNVTPIAALLSVTSIFALLSTSKTAMISARPFALNILRYHRKTGRGEKKGVGPIEYGTNEGNSLQIGLEVQRVIFYFVAVVKCTEIAQSPETVPVIIRT